MDAIRAGSTRPVLQITTHNARLHITSSRPRMRVKSRRPQMRIIRKKPAFRTDIAEMHNQIRGNPGYGFSPQYKARAKQRFLQTVGEIASKGERLMHPEQGQTVPVLAAEVNKKPVPQVVLESLPPDVPKIDWEQGYLSIEWSDYALEIEWEDLEGPRIDVEPHSVEVRVVNQPVVRLRMNPKKVKDAVGSNIDKKV